MRDQKILNEIAVSPLEFKDKKMIFEAYEVIYESTITNTLLLIGMLSSLLYSKESKQDVINKAAQSVYAMLEKTYNTSEQAKADSTVMAILNDMDKKYGKGTSISIMERANAILDIKADANKSSSNNVSSSSIASPYQPSLQQAKLSAQGKSGNKMLFVALFDGDKKIKEFSGDNALRKASEFNADKKYKVMYKIEIANAVNIRDGETQTEIKD